MGKTGLALAGLLILSGCASIPRDRGLTDAGPALCRTSEASIHTDFPTAPPMRCAVNAKRAFTLLVTPEHGPPINDSPWYAFRYTSQNAEPLDIRIDYLGGKHRYRPKQIEGGGATPVSADVAQDRSSFSMQTAGPSGTIAAQEIVGPRENDTLLAHLVATYGARRFTLGTSLRNRAVEAVHIGNEDAPALIVLLGRAHPPEVTGALAMQAFLDRLFADFAADPMLRSGYQVLAVPMLNPDGIASGNWRANAGATDLNRDWGLFTQPETRAVGDWLSQLDDAVRPVVMIDFHSTYENLFYVQAGDAYKVQARFRSQWLGGRLDSLAGYPFRIEPTNANPNAATSKNWFHARYGIPAYTYEVADTANRDALKRAAREFAAGLMPALISAGKDRNKG